MRDESNIRAVEPLGADWMGFIFYPKSPRYVGNQLAYTPEDMTKVGVFVNEDIKTIVSIANNNRLDIIQLHGDESPEVCHILRDEGYKVIKVLGMKVGEPFPHKVTDRFAEVCDYFLFDTRTSNRYGGSGQKFEWQLLADYAGTTPFLLSGGISPHDIEAVLNFSHTQFAGIDLNSAFEIDPALKDVEMLRDFIKRIRMTTPQDKLNLDYKH